MSDATTVTVFSPAKINLFLAVTGRRSDGYHDLVSVVAPMDLGDELTAAIGKRQPPAGGQFSLACDDPEVPSDRTNLVLQAATVFAQRTGWTQPVAFRLTKRIPLGAGLGGGSSNAVAALRALHQLSGARGGARLLAEIAAQVGSDCPLFLPGVPVVMRGRGERVEILPAPAAERLRGRRVLLFKPASLSVETNWAYAEMDRRVPTDFVPAEEAERRLAAWIAGGAGAEDLLHNNMEPAVFRKFVALPELAEQLRREFGLRAHMTGSGSTCFALLPGDAPVDRITAHIRGAWGSPCWLQTAALA